MLSDGWTSLTSPCRRAQLQAALQTLFPADMEHRAQQASRCEPCAEQQCAQQEAARNDVGSSALQDEDSTGATGPSVPAHYGVG